MKILLILLSFVLSSACKILSLSGGGAYGAFESGIFTKLFENNSTYDLITGVSAGSLNAAYLSSIISGQEKFHKNDFKSLWTSIKSEDILHKIYFMNGLSLYDDRPVKSKLTSIFTSIQPIRDIMIGSTSLIDGNKKVFTKEDVIEHGFVDVLMSSIAIPIVFPPYPFLNDLFVDGGVTGNILLNEGINYCKQKYPLDDVYIDVIICGKKLGKYESLSMTIKDIVNRIIAIIAEQVEYSELLHPIFEDNVFITVYEEDHQQGYNILDFDAAEMLWEQGYMWENVNTYWLNTTIPTIP